MCIRDRRSEVLSLQQALERQARENAELQQRLLEQGEQFQRNREELTRQLRFIENQGRNETEDVYKRQVIISVLIGLAVLSTGFASTSRELDSEAERLAGLIGVLTDEAVLDNREYGLRLERDAYQVLRYDEAKARWLPVARDSHRLPEWAELTFEPVSYTHLDVYKRQDQCRAVGQGNLRIRPAPRERCV